MAKFGAAEYLGHQLLTHHQNQRGLIPKTVFHKLWCISDRHLLNNYEVNVGLPRYWYKYGEMADEDLVNDDFMVGPSAPWGGQAYKPVWELEADDFDVPDEERGLIDNTVRWTLDRFRGRDTRDLVSYQYITGSPNDFVRSYSELREHLQYSELDSQEVLTPHVRPNFDVDSNKELVEAYLNEMAVTYPENDEDFQKMQTLYLRWDDTARLVLESDGSFGDLETFLDMFVEALSKIVLKPKYNSNVSAEQIAKWKAESDDVVSEFKAYLDNYRAELLDDYEMSGVLESVADVYDETVISDLEQER